MRERIDIRVDDSVLAENPYKRQRLAQATAIQPVDRNPVIVFDDLWCGLAARGVTFAEYRADPRALLRHNILNAKWRYETYRDDLPIDTERLTVEPRLGSLRATEFPLQIEWLHEQPPSSKPLLTSAGQIDKLALPDPAGGFNALTLANFHGMRAALDDFDVRLNGQPLPVQVSVTHRGGPIPSAFGLCGENLFVWMKTEPERVHRLMELVTESHRRTVAMFDALSGHDPARPLWLGGDIAEMLSPRLFREFAVPYYLRLWADRQRPRTLHMCGKIDHLLEILRDELQIDLLDGFGFSAGRRALGEKLAGRVALRGGPHPGLIREGPVALIEAECEDYIRTVGHRGGYILGEGFTLAPGTPPSHVAAMVTASARVGPCPRP